MRYYTTNIISANLELTPEGYLLAKNVPIARTGEMTYLGAELVNEKGEMLVTPVAGLVRVERTADEVFRPETIASFEGKAVTLNHPSEDVGPTNWSQLAKGIVQNVRRGLGLQDDLLLADLLITDGRGIGEVRDGLREVSCGYQAEYEEIAPGRGRQLDIVGNHVALVEKGRCGSRCAIGDSLMKKPKWMDRLRVAFKNRDEAELEEALKESTSDQEAETEEAKKKREDEEEKSKTSDSLTRIADSLLALGSRLTALESKRTADEEAETEEEKKKREDEEKEKESKTSDSSALLAEAQDVRARVEILSPGMTIPTFDAAGDVAKVRDSLCVARRRALEAAYANPKTRDAVAPLVAGRDLLKLTCDALHSTFVGASEIVRRENNAQSRGTGRDAKFVADHTAPSASSINRRNAEFWKERQ